MSTKNKGRGNPRGAREGKEKGKKKNNKNEIGRGSRPLHWVRQTLCAPSQWAIMFLQMLTDIPVKRGESPQSSTVSDVVVKMRTWHIFKTDLNLAIDVFRELKQQEAQDCYGNRFSFKVFNTEFLFRHPALGRYWLKRDLTLRGDWFRSPRSNRYLTVRNKAFNKAFDKAEKSAKSMHYASFEKWLYDKKNVSMKEFLASPESMRAPYIQEFGPVKINWPGEDITKHRKITVRKGQKISKNLFRKAFEFFYDRSEGKANIPTGYVLSGTVKVQPERVLHMDGTHSYQKMTGDHVSYDIEWDVVETPWYGEGEFYLNRRLNFGGRTISPAKGHLLGDPDVLRSWNGAGSFRLGWQPNIKLSAAYGPYAEECFVDEELELDFTRGHWIFSDGQWTEKETVEKRN